MKRLPFGALQALLLMLAVFAVIRVAGMLPPPGSGPFAPHPQHGVSWVRVILP